MSATLFLPKKIETLIQDYISDMFPELWVPVAGS